MIKGPILPSPSVHYLKLLTQDRGVRSYSFFSYSSFKERFLNLVFLVILKKFMSNYTSSKGDLSYNVEV